MEDYMQKYGIKWPEIYLREGMDSAIAKQYCLPRLPHTVLVDPKGRIVATSLRGERLTRAIKQAVSTPGEPMRESEAQPLPRRQPVK